MVSNITYQMLVSLFNEPEKAVDLDDSNWQPIIFVLRHEQLLARYALKFKNAGIFERLTKFAQHHFRNSLILYKRQSEQVFREANNLHRVLKKHSSFAIYLKGAGYTLSGHVVGQGRVYGDIDILVAKSALSDIEKYLCIRDWISEPVTDYDDRYYRHWAHEIPPLRNSIRGTILDIHHNIVPPVSGKAPNVEHLLKHSKFTIEGHQVLSPAAMTLHSAVHLFFNEDFKHGFRDLMDLHILISEESSESYWSSLLDLAKSTGFLSEIYMACRYAKKLFHTDVPAYVIETLNECRPVSTKLQDFIFEKVLLPKHPLCKVDKYEVAEFLAWVRGHALKMPFNILVYHMTVKGGRNIFESIFGKHVFTKQDDLTK